MSTWKPTPPSAKVVQDNYVKARATGINAQFSKCKTDTIAAFKSDTNLARVINAVPPADRDKFCAHLFDHLTAELQKRDLTINFGLGNWFKDENSYESYAQMYERHTVNGKMILDKGDDLNPTLTRVAADDRVTFPKDWVTPSKPLPGGSPPGARPPNTLGVRPPPPLQRGLMPGTQSPQRIMGRMMAGKELVEHKQPIPDDLLNKGDSGGFESPNRRFNPKTKQIFAALNYGRRPHGSNVEYGHSYFILNPRFKANALYYPCDTFYVPGTQMQVTYQTLGAIFLHAHPEMRQALVVSCMGKILGRADIPLHDTIATRELLEAHIFAEVRFADGISQMVMEKGCLPFVMQNAVKFCKKWGISFR